MMKQSIYFIALFSFLFSISNLFAQVQIGQDMEGERFKDMFGTALSMPDPTTVAIGNGGGFNPHLPQEGYVKIFELDAAAGALWIQKGQTLFGEALGDNSGWSVSMANKNLVAIGARSNSENGTGSGHVRVFEWLPAGGGGMWNQLGGDIDGENAGDSSGEAISMAPNSYTVAIGSPNNSDNGNDSGHVRVFDWDANGGWQQRGGAILGDAAGDLSGYDVDMPDANTVAIGAPNFDGGGSATGQVKVYIWHSNPGVWVQRGGDIIGEAAGDRSGVRVNMADANTIAIGAPDNDGDGVGQSVGHVRVFVWSPNSGIWVQKGGDINGEAVGDNSGVGVSMPDPNTIAIGSRFNEPNGMNDAGQTRIYRCSDNEWIKVVPDINGAGYYAQSGFEVSMPNANTIAISGEGQFVGSFPHAGHVRVFDLQRTSHVPITPTSNYSMNFETGLDNHWETSNDANGIAEVTSDFTSCGGTQHLVLCHGTSGQLPTSLNHADLYLDLSAINPAVDPVYVRYVLNSYGADDSQINTQDDGDDGIWISDDGGCSFTKVGFFDTPNLLNDNPCNLIDFNLSRVIENANLGHTDKVILRFQQRNSEPCPQTIWNSPDSRNFDGVTINNVNVYTKPGQTFVAQLPSMNPFFGTLEPHWVSSNEAGSIDPVIFDFNSCGPIFHLTVGTYSSTSRITSETLRVDLSGVDPSTHDVIFEFTPTAYGAIQNDPNEGIFLSDGFVTQRLTSFGSLGPCMTRTINISTLMPWLGLSYTNNFSFIFQQNTSDVLGIDGAAVDDVNVFLRPNFGNRSISTRNGSEEIELYPNPTDALLSINIPEELNKEGGTLSIIDMHGRELQRDEIPSETSQLRIPTADLSGGTYFLNLNLSDVRYVKKFLVVHE